MTDAPLPGLPADPGDPRRRIVMLWVFIGSMGLCLVVGVIAIVALASGGGPPPEPDPGPLVATTNAPAPARTNRPPVALPPARDEEGDARRFFEEAEAAERAGADRPDLAIARYRDVRVRYPQTTWAAKAARRTTELEDRIKAIFEAEFEGVRREAHELCAAGNFRAAIEALQRYQQTSSKELLKKRADAEIGAIDNEARAKFNGAVRQAQGLARQGRHEEAAALFRSLEAFAPPGVHAACGIEIDSINEARAGWAEKLQRDAELKADEQFFGAGPSLLEACTKHRFDEALKAIGALPASPAARDEREVVVAAAEFWEAFLRGYRVRLGQEVSLRLAEDKRVTGKLAKVEADRAIVGAAEVPHDSLHDDQVVLLAFVTDALPAADPASYVKVAMHFFIRGRRELSRSYLATARELGAKIESVERAWRGGALRAALVAKK